MKTHKNLDVWKMSIDFVQETYQTSKSFPREELYGIVSQLRRASVSVPSNIAEGFARPGKKELLRFLYFSLGSLSEIETLLIICRRLNYPVGALEELLIPIRRKLINLIKYIKSKG
jgi:four helix bundle protein